MKAIGVFDSGIGGLTVVKELMRQLPNEDIVYLGDTARLPYGIKSTQTVTRFTLENILFLLKFNIKLIIVACNTASSLALPVIRHYFRIPIIGVITSGVKEAVYATRTKCIGVIGTRSTIKSKAYEKEIKSIDSSVKVISLACPLFVPLVEENWFNTKETEQIADQYLKPFKKTKVDVLILGCTHYPLLKPVIKKVLGDKVKLIDSARQVVNEVKGILDNEGLRLKNKRKGKMSFYVTDEPECFRDSAYVFLGRKAANMYHLNPVRNKAPGATAPPNSVAGTSNGVKAKHTAVKC
ncbi:MAG: glutamate racemase [Candidatus Omnitrophica bacterium]|nr:glutamate racemase [Candidatus Omnitrophota bacterium]